jgi:thioredoxin reductase (NADPH)
VPVSVAGLSVEDGYKRLRLADGREILARSIIAATGMKYREHGADGIAAFTGAGVYYGAATTEAYGCRDRRVVIVGGGNSAGQSAVYLSGLATAVSVVIRRDGLSSTMSQYLIEQCASRPNLRIRPRTVIDRAEGNGRLERVWFKSVDDGSLVAEDVDALFIFIGTKPHSDWLPESILRNDKGFVLTGRDVSEAPGFSKHWKEQRDPLLLETSAPGVFAAGDLRAGAMNRVAAAVGEGAMAIRLVGEYLSRT